MLDPITLGVFCLQENIDLQSTILSRFDLIFIVKDERSVERDMMVRVRAACGRGLAAGVCMDAWVVLWAALPPASLAICFLHLLAHTWMCGLYTGQRSILHVVQASNFP